MPVFYLREYRKNGREVKAVPILRIIADSLGHAQQIATEASKPRVAQLQAKGFVWANRQWILPIPGKSYYQAKYSCKHIVTHACTRCGKENGIFTHFSHVIQGICFKCFGSGDEERPNAAVVSPATSAKMTPADWAEHNQADEAYLKAKKAAADLIPTVVPCCGCLIAVATIEGFCDNCYTKQATPPKAKRVSRGKKSMTIETVTA